MKHLLIILITLCSMASYSQTVMGINNNILKVSTDSVSLLNSGNGVTLGVTSGINLVGNTTAWDDLMFPFQTGSTGGGSYPAFVADSGYFLFSAIDTTGPSKCVMYITVQMPHTWKEGTRIYPHVHYQYESAVGVPIFKMKYKWTSITDWQAGTWKWLQMSTNTGTKNYSHQLVDNAGGISGSGQTFSSIIICQVYLGATSPVNIKAWQFDIHFEKSRMGTNAELH